MTMWTFAPNHELRYDEQWDSLHTLGPYAQHFQNIRYH